MNFLFCRHQVLVMSITLLACQESPPMGDLEKVQRMFEDYHHQFESLPRAKTQDILKQPSQWIFVDARSEEEQKISTLPGALSKEGFIKDKAKYQEKKIAVYCTIGLRSAHLATELRQKGMEAYNLEGGILGWIHNGGNLVDSNQKPTNHVHVYGEKWNLVPPSFHPTY